jgi:cytochrome c oxidase cbb3-type subunit I/II
VDPEVIAGRMRALQKLGVPYSDEDLALAGQRFASQGQLIVEDLLSKDVSIAPDSEMAAVIAYLQRLGRGPQPVTQADLQTPPEPATEPAAEPAATEGGDEKAAPAAK